MNTNILHFFSYFVFTCFDFVFLSQNLNIISFLITHISYLHLFHSTCYIIEIVSIFCFTIIFTSVFGSIKYSEELKVPKKVGLFQVSAVARRLTAYTELERLTSATLSNLTNQFLVVFSFVVVHLIASGLTSDVLSNSVAAGLSLQQDVVCL